MTIPTPANDNPDHIEIGFANLAVLMEHCNAVSTYLADLAEIASGTRPDQNRFRNRDDETASQTLTVYLLRLRNNYQALVSGMLDLFDSLEAGNVPMHLAKATMSNLPSLFADPERNILDREPAYGTPEHLAWQNELARGFMGSATDAKA